jgi:hypothetical protein
MFANMNTQQPAAQQQQTAPPTDMFASMNLSQQQPQVQNKDMFSSMNMAQNTQQQPSGFGFNTAPNMPVQPVQQPDLFGGMTTSAPPQQPVQPSPVQQQQNVPSSGDAEWKPKTTQGDLWGQSNLFDLNKLKDGQTAGAPGMNPNDGRKRSQDTGNDLLSNQKDLDQLWNNPVQNQAAPQQTPFNAGPAPNQAQPQKPSGFTPNLGGFYPQQQ